MLVKSRVVIQSKNRTLLRKASFVSIEYGAAQFNLVANEQAKTS